MNPFKIFACTIWLLYLGFPQSVFAQCNLNVSTTKRAFKSLKNKEQQIRYLDSLEQVFVQCQVEIKADSLAANGYYFLARRYKYMGDFSTALAFDHKALDIRKRILNPKNLLIPRSLWGIASIHLSDKKYDEAINYNKQAIEILQDNKIDSDPILLLRCYRDLGQAYSAIGEYHNAGQYSQMVADIYAAANDTLNATFTYNNLAINLLHRDLGDSALYFLDKAERQLLEFKKGRPAIVEQRLLSIYANKANAYQVKKDNPKALEFYQKVLSNKSISPEKRFPCLENMGMIFQEQGDYSKAFELHNKVLKDKQLFYKTKQHRKLAVTYDHLGDSYRNKGAYLKALENYNTAIQQVIPQFRNEKNTYKNPNLQEMTILGAASELLVFISSKALTFQLLYKQTGDKKDLQAALETYKVADALIDKMRQEHREDASKLFWRKTTRPTYEQAIETAYLLNDYESALYFMEKSKAVLLADALNERSASQKANLPQEKLQKISTLKSELYAVAQQEEEQAEYLQIKGKLEALINSLEQKYPAYYQFKYNDIVPDLAQVRKGLLNDTTAFLGYFVSDSVMYALQITRNDVHLDKVNYNQKARAQWLKMIDLASDPDLFMTKDKEIFLAINKQLTKRIWKPISPSINHYLIAPDGWLNYLNFEILISPAKNAPPQQAEQSQRQPFLIQDNTFNYTWSATVSQYVRQERPRAKQQFLGIAPYQFSAYSQLGTLENSLKELDFIQEIISGASLSKATATKEALRAKLTQDYRIVHFATHAQADGNEPFIALYDQKIHLSDLYQLDLSNTELVTLSACESSIGEWQEGEGVASLARACIYAGSQSIVASQWKVSDETTAVLMQHFYTYLAEGLPKNEALRQAKLQLMEAAAAPAGWAALVFVGNPSGMEDLEGAGARWWIWGLGFLVVFFGALGLVRRR